MPINGERLVVEPSFPMAQALMAMGRNADDIAEAAADEADKGWTLRNRWYSRDWRCDIILMEKDGKIDFGKLPAFHHIKHDLATLGCSDAWGMEQEANAIDLLHGLVSPRQFKHYMMTGMFIETSKRSGVTYIFRRLKPTVALAAHPGLPEGKFGMTILACLCMHPIAYYADSWAGAMVPTDDVIAHLQLMRADEKLYWRRANQHPPYRPEAGL